MRVTEEEKEQVIELVEQAIRKDVLNVRDVKKILLIVKVAASREIEKILGGCK